MLGSAFPPVGRDSAGPLVEPAGEPLVEPASEPEVEPTVEVGAPEARALEEETGGEEGGARSPDAVIAGVHLRTGLHALARAELETLAGRGALDAPALVDLAEVRWRTGDLVGAGDAARACLEAGLSDTIVFCIAAEAAASVGRTSDARELAGRALAAEPERLDELFAGQPRSSVWPPPRIPAPPSTPPGAVPPGQLHGIPMIPPLPAPPAYAPGGMAAAGPAPPVAQPGREVSASAAAGLVDAQALVARGELGGLAVRLLLVLREQPILAPAVLAVADDALRLGPAAHERASLHLVRADAYRLMGRETLSREALQEAARALRGSPQSQDSGDRTPEVP
jgi:hypothetical protein